MVVTRSDDLPNVTQAETGLEVSFRCAGGCATPPARPQHTANGSTPSRKEKNADDPPASSPVAGPAQKRSPRRSPSRKQSRTARKQSKNPPPAHPPRRSRTTQAPPSTPRSTAASNPETPVASAR